MRNASMADVSEFLKLSVFFFLFEYPFPSLTSSELEVLQFVS